MAENGAVGCLLLSFGKGFAAKMEFAEAGKGRKTDMRFLKNKNEKYDILLCLKHGVRPDVKTCILTAAHIYSRCNLREESVVFIS